MEQIMNNSTILLIAALVFILLIWFVTISNRLTRRRNQADNAFASVDAYLKKRFDLIPNLVAAVQQYMAHEKSVLTELTALRAQAMKGNLSADEKMDINSKMTNALRSVNVAVENYPDLKADKNFLQLQAALNEVEEQLSASRRAFNAAVLSYNNGVQLFPSNIVAAMRGLKARKYFETDESERRNVDLKSLFKS